jgi:hypothetical protein
LGCVVGTFIEPVTRRPRSWSRATRLAIGANLCASAALVGAGTWHWATAIGQARYAGWSPRLWQPTGVPARRGSGRDPGKGPLYKERTGARGRYSCPSGNSWAGSSGRPTG